MAADRLGFCVRDGDTVARIGGDEFLIVLGGILDKQQISKITERIIKAISEPFKIEGALPQVSASVGISIFPQHANDPDRLIKLADQAMYDIKKQGENNFAFACEER